MLQMMKRDYFISKAYLLMMFISIPFVYVINLSPLFFMVIMTIGTMTNLFYYDHHNHTNRFIVSLPINRKMIVLSRYLFIMIVIGLLFPYLWSIDYLMHTFIFPMLSDRLPTLDFQPLAAILIVLAFIITIISIAVSLPIYYFFQSLIKSIIAQVSLFMITIIFYVVLVLNIDLIPEQLVVGLVKFIDFQPVLFVITLLVTFLTISYLLSIKIFTQRDIE